MNVLQKLGLVLVLFSSVSNATIIDLQFAGELTVIGGSAQLGVEPGTRIPLTGLMTLDSSQVTAAALHFTDQYIDSANITGNFVTRLDYNLGGNLLSLASTNMQYGLVGVLTGGSTSGLEGAFGGLQLLPAFGLESLSTGFQEVRFCKPGAGDACTSIASEADFNLNDPLSSLFGGSVLVKFGRISPLGGISGKWTQVPEPASGALFGIALAAMIFFVRYRGRRQQRLNR